ncbi:MAG TPA: HAD family hydrolase [Candidatus Desulfaltia sp.]|nr:HAD family hydrolase [Candidatus Desulfaltia sp.]
MPLNIDSVVFDLDATLINLGEHVEWRKAHIEIAEAYTDLGCSPLDVEACSGRGLFGMLDEMWEINIKKLGAEKANSIQIEAYNILHAHEEKGVTGCTLMPGCLDALNWVKDQEVPMGICTSNSQATAEQALKAQSLSHYFDAVIGRSTAHRMKPSPDQLKACYEQLGAKPENSVIVGDSHKDVMAGKALGSYTIAIPVYFTRLDRVKEAGIDVIIDSLAELPQALAAIKKLGR